LKVEKGVDQKSITREYEGGITKARNRESTGKAMVASSERVKKA